ncbi:hypothetical protein [Methylocystis sp.]|jgi:hypothetical protein|uniref:hypothetical protein n=1 Tax=Methylocystis sp. TaxID=1911079 RepID=UPI0025F94456|nr:hypothetical protein [Methylocystis sp.]
MPKFVAPVGRRAFALLFAGVLIVAGCSFSAYAEPGPGAAYVISDQEGYGLLECLTGKADCGQIVADSWCAAHGHGAARAFGRADDVTASTDVKATGASIQPDAAIVACMD